MKAINPTTGETIDFSKTGTYKTERNPDGTVSLKYELPGNFKQLNETLGKGVTATKRYVKTENGRTTLSVTLNTDGVSTETTTATARYGAVVTNKSGKQKFNITVMQNKDGEVAVNVTQISNKASLNTLADEFTKNTEEFQKFVGEIATEAFAADTVAQQQ
jgi:hypothetical protein